MIRQGPKMQRAIRYEHQWLKKKVAKYGFDIVISDNDMDYITLSSSDFYYTSVTDKKPGR